MKARDTRSPLWPLGKAAAAMVTLTAASAWATDYNISGSDTVYDILTKSLQAWKADPDTTTPHNLIYLGGGSGTAENAMTRRVDGGISPTQSIGGMSRNFKENFIGDPAYGLAPPAPWNSGVMLIPDPSNVIALDAVVVAESNRIRACDNLRINMDATDITHEHAVVDNPLALILGGKSSEPPRCSGDRKA